MKKFFHILNSFSVVLILLILIYFTRIHRHLLFDLLPCAIFFLILLLFNLLPPLFLCPPSPPYMDHQTLLISPSLSYFTWCHIRHIISSPAPTTYSPSPISPPPGDCTVSSYLMSPLDFVYKTNSSPSSINS